MKRFITTFLFLTSLLYAQGRFVKWEKLPFKIADNPEIICGQSIDNFWFHDNKGNLFHKSGNKVIKFKFPKKYSLSHFIFKKINKGTFILGCFDINWNSHIFYFENGKWEKDSLVIRDKPLSSIIVFRKDLIYIVGNWGLFYRFSQGRWEKLDTPFKNHVSGKKDGEGTIWIGVRGEGIFSYDGKNFHKYKIHGPLAQDFTPVVICDTLFGFGSSLDFYVLNKKGNFFESIHHKPRVSYFIPDKFGFYRINSLFVGKNIKYTIPQTFMPYTFFKLDDGSILITSKNGKIFYATILKNNFFDDLSLIYRINGSEIAPTAQADFLYMDNDILPEVFILRSSLHGFSSIFLNKPNSPFYDITERSGLILKTRPINFIFGDINGDLKNDLVLNTFNKGNKLVILLQNGNGIFTKRQVIKSPDKFNSRGFRNLCLLDFNRDGYLDIGITSYYGYGIKSGAELFALNKKFYGMGKINTTYVNKTRGWNIQLISADFNSDGLNDLLIVSQWRNLRLLLRRKNNPAEFKTIYLTKNKNEAFFGAVAFDYDNDGDLDIFSASDKQTIYLFRNNGNGNFEEVADKVGFRKVNRKNYSYEIKRFMTYGDFNNDGFTDLFFSLSSPFSPRNYLFINDSAKMFLESAAEFGIRKPYVNAAAVGDVDADGDLDLLAFNSRHNFLWINNRNDSNFIEIIPKGIKSNLNGIGAKITLYKSGHLNEKFYLNAYTQLGSNDFNRGAKRQLLAHFGVKHDESYDVKVEFYGGETKIIKNVNAGQILAVRELSEMESWIYLLPGNIIRFLLRTENQIYLLIILLSFLLLAYGVKSGIRKYHWSLLTSISILFINLSIFWILILLGSQNGSFLIKFIVPLFFVFIGVLLPHIIFFSIFKSGISKKVKAEMEEELLKKMILFTHGKWAQRNINALKLLLENPPATEDKFSQFYSMINKRGKTFIDLTVPLINQIIVMLEALNIEKENRGTLKQEIEILMSEFGKTIVINSFTVNGLKNFGVRFSIIKKLLTEIRNSIFVSSSCDPEEVVKQIASEFENEMIKNNILFKKSKNYANKLKILIKNYDLAVVIDNCLQNSIRAVSEVDNPVIQIIIRKKSPIIIIDITDNGCGITKESEEKIFEEGFSKYNSSGKGLVISKRLVEKYSGKIFVKESSPNVQTVISIELLEGR